ncbi:MAG: acetate--CoA ligase [Sterolibacteriaceae bacterium]|nr:acetate--CoA ligase [Sterolibacteriaceae bacterium]
MSANESAETRLYPPPAEFAAKAAIPSMAAYQALCDEADKDYEGFWARLAREHVAWKKPFTQILDSSNAPFFKWFADGQLNVSYNCLDRQVEAGLGDKTAIIFEADNGDVSNVSYTQLLARVSQFANGLKKLGIKKGDRVVIYMSMGVEGIVAMQACARIGATHSVVFGGFSAQSLRDRIEDAAAVAVITSDGQFRGGKNLPLKPRDEGVTMKWAFDIRPEDIFWCTADIGWVTGHTYITYGPLACGATEIVFEGIPTYPDAGRFWRMIQDHKVNIFYTAPTAIRSLIKAGDTNPAVAPTKYELSSLRLLGTVGEPINPTAWTWYHQSVGGGRCPIVDTFWQTETGGHMITPLPGATPLIPGSCTLPFPGIIAAIVDETGTDVPNGSGGILVVKKPWPAMIRTIWNDPDRFRKSYYPADFQGKYYLAGDGAIRDKDSGYFTITGRIDDVLNVSGHRMGTMEVESALVAHPKVAEAAVVGRPDDLTGEAIVAFVVLRGARPKGDEAKKLVAELQAWVGKEIGPIAKPKDIRFGENLPKTRSGKIMRRLLRSLAKGEDVTQDTSTLENPAILEQLKRAAN